ncbi:MAG: flagellar hook-basal body complex protein FliE [Gammaproteobacteria bacterium]|nr:flagellar hook-basal body complex protein FliE [Gammaproteobacteria bacterium]NNF60060.1 flagellar hook-basal body complex protein FliE [Gammaproteobacteria bacterium]
MSEIDISRVLADMRALAAQAKQQPTAADKPAETGQADFGELLRQSVDKVNETQKAAGAMAEKFESGDPNVDVTQVMLALQKADVSFKAMTEVRNKLVEAYREIMNMPI